MRFLFARKTSKFNGYVLHRQLGGHSGAIIALCATEDGRFLASGASDGTKVWDLQTMHSLASPKSPETRGATTALVWLKSEDNLSEALLSGTQNGYLACWKMLEELYCVRLIQPAEITDLAFDAPTNRLGVCHRGGIVQVYSLGGAMSLERVFSIELRSVVPRAIVFGKMEGNTREVMVFGLYGGDV
ncbi:WD40-repeat-containing domain protein [Mycena amicta]|nr:WD40-repeat-containing domain protein [Mycena amicta]